MNRELHGGHWRCVGIDGYYDLGGWLLLRADDVKARKVERSRHRLAQSAPSVRALQIAYKRIESLASSNLLLIRRTGAVPYMKFWT